MRDLLVIYSAIYIADKNFAYKVKKSLYNQANDRILINNIHEEKSIKHYEQLWYNENAKE